MSYGVALRNGVPFTLGTIAALCVNATSQAFNPLVLWPDGIATPGMWSSPRTLTSEWQDYTGTTPVAAPGTVADSANPVGLALDIRAGAPEVLGPELCTGVPSMDANWTDNGNGTYTSDGNIGYITWPGGIPGKMYQASITCHTYAGTWVAGRIMDDWSPFATSVGTFTTRVICAPGNTAKFYSPGFAGIASFSVREVPGNHMLQSTSAARPLLSARVNLLTYTEDFSNVAWQLLLGLEKTPNYALAPDGTMTACRLYAPTAGGILYGHGVFITNIVRSVWAKSNTGDSYSVSWGSGGTDVVTPTWQQIGGPASGFLYLWQLAVDEAGGDISIWHPQTERGTTATDYQAVLGDGSTYATGFPIAQLYDGADDGMATAAFTAGTLIAGMDCLIAVRRDSAALPAIGGLYQADQTKYFGVIGIGSGDTAPTYGGCGAPSLFVDGIAVANERGALYGAIGVGDWHILEYRGLDLSAWVNAAWGAYPTYLFNGPRGDILLYPSTTPTTDKDAARQWLADYYGVTLP